MKDDDSDEEAPAERLRVFLCHSRKDKPQVRELYQSLRDDGFRPWLDEEDLLVGQDWQSEIPKAVRASHVVIVCLSHNSVSEAGYVHKEILIALEVAERQPEGTMFILPVRLQPCEIPERLHNRHWANLFEEGGYSRLTKALRACARARGLLTPEPEVKGAAARRLTAAQSHGKAEPLPPEPRADKKGGSKLLPLTGAALLVAAAVTTIFLSLGAGRGEKAVVLPADNTVALSLVPSDNRHPAPILRPEPRTETTPEQPPATPVPTPTPTPAPAETQARVGRVEDKEGDDDAPPATRPPSTLGGYRVDIISRGHSQQRKKFAEEIGRHLKQYVSRVKVSGKPFPSPAAGCQVRYFNASKGDPRNEDAVANVLMKQLNGVYPKAEFAMYRVSDPKWETPNIISLVIGDGCKK